MYTHVRIHHDMCHIHMQICLHMTHRYGVCIHTYIYMYVSLKARTTTIYMDIHTYICIFCTENSPMYSSKLPRPHRLSRYVTSRLSFAVHTEDLHMYTYV